MTDTIQLSFAKAGSQAVELLAVHYRPTGWPEELLSVRGRTAGAYGNAGTFQWTAAVQGVCAVLLKAILHDKMADSQPYISGERSSIAASLDYALAKGPAWLFDMFGVTSLGGLRAKRLFRITNPSRKRPGPVVVSLNTNILPSSNIRVTLNGTPVEDTCLLLRMVESFLERGLKVRDNRIQASDNQMQSPHALLPTSVKVVNAQR